MCVCVCGPAGTYRWQMRKSRLTTRTGEAMQRGRGPVAAASNRQRARGRGGWLHGACSPPCSHWAEHLLLHFVASSDQIEGPAARLSWKGGRPCVLSVQMSVRSDLWNFSSGQWLVWCGPCLVPHSPAQVQNRNSGGLLVPVLGSPKGAVLREGWAAGFV